MTFKNDSSSAQKPSILIVAAEASSALYAQRLLELFQRESLDVHFFGIGSRAMEERGFERIGRSEDMAVVGLQEVLGEFKNIRRVFYSILERAQELQPRCALLLDYPDFNLRLAKKLKSLGVPVLYFISPQLWAWRTGRVKQIQAYVEKMLVLFPFEESFYQSHGVDVRFVGHPILDELDAKYLSLEYKDQKRKEQGISPERPLLGLMPGSRRSEIKHHLATQVETAELLMKKFPDLQVALFLAPSLEESDVQEYLSKSQSSIRTIQDEPLNMISMADLILCASGTATLMVGLLEKPMVIMYKMNPLSAFFARRLVTQVKHFGMPNLILEEEAVPEFFQEEAHPVQLSQIFEQWIENPEKKQSSVNKLKQLKEKLGQTGAMKRVFEQVKRYLF